MGEGKLEEVKLEEEKLEEGKREEEPKVEKKTGCYTVLTIVGILLIIGLDTFACFMGVQAEAAQQNVEHKRALLLECKAPSQTAFVLGILALSGLVASHIIANLIGCSSKLFTSPTFTSYFNLICCALTWIVGIVGAGALLMGVWSNRVSRSECGFTNKHMLSFGGYACFVHAFLSIFFYVSSIFARKSCC